MMRLTKTKNFQVKTVIVVRFLLEEERIIGKIMLVNGGVKKNLGGKTETIKVCGREEERIRALKEYFGIELTREEQEGVKGRNVELCG